MKWIKSLFGLERKEKNLLDEAQELAKKIIPARYRSLARANGIAPTDATTDEQIVAIYTQVCAGFRFVAKERGEEIPAENLHRIVLKFLNVFEDRGADFYRSHLQYELDLYRNKGLREDYKNPLKLF
jgi:hypothetical protein